MKQVTFFQMLKAHRTVPTAFILLAAGFFILGIMAFDSLKTDARVEYQVDLTRNLEKDLDRLIFNRFPVQAANLVRDAEIVRVAKGETRPDNEHVLHILQTAQLVAEASIVYVMNRSGTVVGCSPYDHGRTLTGNNYSFRPYFLQAMKGETVVYPALGVTTYERGFYFSVPIPGSAGDFPEGVLVYKASLVPIDDLLKQLRWPVVLLSPDGIVFASNRLDWLYQAVLPLDASQKKKIIESKQFADQPLLPLPFSLSGSTVVVGNTEYAVRRIPIRVADWEIGTLVSLDAPYPISSHRLQIYVGSFFFYLVMSGIILVLLFNISKRKMMEQELRASQEKYRSLFEDSPVSLWEEDFSQVKNYFDQLALSGVEDLPQHIGAHPEVALECAKKIQIVDVNRATVELFRARTKEELIGGLDKVLAPGSEVEIQKELMALARKQTVFETEVLNRTLDGENRIVRLRLSVAPGFEKSLAKVLVSMLDVTAQIRAVEALRESELRYKKILETSPYPVAIFDRGDQVSYINPAFMRVFGWSYDDLPNQLTDYVPKELYSQFRDLFDCMVRGESVLGGEIRLFNKAGELLDINVSFASWRNREGFPVSRVVILQDITDQKKLEAQLRQAQKMEAIGTLAGGLAHDFNNILQGISGYINLIMLRNKLDSTDSEYLRTVDRTIRRSTGMIRQLLTISRDEESDLKPLDFNKEIQETCNLLARTIPRTIKIETRLSAEPLIIKADSIQLEQVILNLGTNARDAMPHGGELVFETRRMELDEEFCQTRPGLKPGSYALFNTSDSGTGMKPEIIERIFEPFFTTKDSAQGTGLGLAMVYSIIKNHKGHISCYSEPGQGTTFSVYLPLHDEPAAIGETESERQSELVGGQESILVVDDDLGILETIQAILEQFGYTVFRAENGEEAIKLYREEGKKIDFVIMDMNMPGMGGVPTLRQLLEIDSRIKVLITSGLLADQKIKEAMKIGAVGFLGKPYRLTDLLGTIRALLDKYE